MGDEEEGPREGELREQDRFLPIYNISKVMKKVVPHSGKVAKEARECVQECVSEFISFITSEASERCQAEKRKTINGEDILFAMSTLGFDNYVEPLKLYLQKYRESMKVKNNREKALKKLTMLYLHQHYKIFQLRTQVGTKSCSHTVDLRIICSLFN